jgi:hypothetical protein
MHTIHERTRLYFGSLFWAMVVGLLVFALVVASGGCAGVPRTPQQMEEMSEPEFDDLLVRVQLWSQLAADQVTRKHPEAVEKILMYASLVEGLAKSDDPLGQAAGIAGLADPLAAILVLEGKALLNARGGLPGGERTVALLGAVAAGIRQGVVASPRVAPQ